MVVEEKAADEVKKAAEVVARAVEMVAMVMVTLMRG